MWPNEGFAYWVFSKSNSTYQGSPEAYRLMLIKIHFEISHQSPMTDLKNYFVLASEKLLVVQTSDITIKVI